MKKKLLKNKIVAIVLIVLFVAAILVNPDSAPAIAFFTLPTAVILIFSRVNWID